MSLSAENLLDSRMFWSKLYLQNSAYSHILFHCIIIMHEVGLSEVNGSYSVKNM